MSYEKKDSILRFVYSCPYEDALLKLADKKPSKKLHQKGLEMVGLAQKIWNEYEESVLNLFKKIYKIKVSEKSIKSYISLIAPNSYSNPLTISLKSWLDIDKNPRSRRGFLYAVIHELAHYFSYTRNNNTYFNKLLIRIQEKNILGSRNANSHYLIQAVEFGIIEEIFGKAYAEYSRDWVIRNWKDNDYGKSARLLKANAVPLNKKCLSYILNNL